MTVTKLLAAYIDVNPPQYQGGPLFCLSCLFRKHFRTQRNKKKKKVMDVLSQLNPSLYTNKKHFKKLSEYNKANITEQM